MREPAPAKVYTLYERLWHGTQAVSVLLLIATAVEIRTGFGALGFPGAVRVHETVGFVLLGNAALGLFWFVATGAIRRYVTRPGEIARDGLRQVRWYLRGIFRGAPHPLRRGERLNPLQKATYVLLLNVLLPGQVLTGLAIWGIGRWPRIEELLGGLDVLVPLHVAGAWAFAADLVVHVYLSTTVGPRPGSAFRTIVTGREERAAPPPAPATVAARAVAAPVPSLEEVPA